MKDEIASRLKSLTGPIPDDLILAIDQLRHADALEVLRHHPGFAIQDKKRSLENTHNLFFKAHRDLLRGLDEFDEKCRSPDYFLRSRQHDAEELDLTVRKEIFAFSDLAHSLVEHSRQLKNYEPPGRAAALARSFGDDGLHEFVIKLRNALHHQNQVESQWVIRASGPTQTSHYVLHKIDLLAPSIDWDHKARAFIGTARDPIDVRTLVEDYANRVRSYYDWYFPELDTVWPPEAQEYEGILLNLRRRSARLNWRLLLITLINNKFDPYASMERYLTPEDIRVVKIHPDGSRAQVDAIIEIIDEYGACDDEVRSLAYRLFGIHTS